VATKITLPPMVHLEAGLYETPATYAAVDQVDCDLFLTLLREYGVPSYAARQMGRGEAAFQLEKSRNPEFSAAWEWAIRESADILLIEARRRAKEGVDKPIFNRGEEIAVVKEYSDSLLIKLLEGLHPNFQKNRDDDEGSGRNNTVSEIHIKVIPAESFIPKEAAEQAE
jgi:hypothetical protein